MWLANGIGDLMQSKSKPDPGGVAADAPRVLVVEDEFLIRMVVSDHLRESGFVVLEAFNGDEAIDILKSGVLIDLIFTDVRMPGEIDGLGLLAYSILHRPDLPVVVTSGHLEPSLAFGGGAAQFLVKPCTLEVVASAIRAALKHAA